MITEEMKEHFDNRTHSHIRLVIKYIEKIIDLNEMFESLRDRAFTHDASKFKEPEYTPYIYITGMYKCKREGVDWEMPDGIQDRATKATIHHILANKHHPEYWDENFDADTMFNSQNRDDTPKKMVDGTKMKVISIMEMMADGCAVAEERGTNPMNWLNANVNKRWKFTDAQIKFMKKLITDIGE